ncbi:MAG: cation:proton antiporter [bacterium]
MDAVEKTTLLIILVVGVLAPLLSHLTPRVRLPVIVLEIALGIVVGPQGFHWGEVGPVIHSLSRFGLAFLFFLAGFEINFNVIRGKPLRLAGVGWLFSLALALSLGKVLQLTHLVFSDIVTSVVLTTTALGVLLPILKDEGEMTTRLGAYAVATATMGEFGPIVMISLLLTKEEGGGFETLSFMALFTLIVIVAAFLAARLRPPALIEFLRKKMNSSSALPLRLSILILAILVTLTQQFGLESILGAVAAGVVVSLAAEGEGRALLQQKFEAIGYGFLIPIFFIATGMTYDLNSLISSPEGLLRVPLFLLLFLIVRGVPVLLYKELPKKDLMPLAFFSATALPLVVAITEIGVQTHRMRPENAAALVGAGMISVFCFPAVALGLRRRAGVLRENKGKGLSRVDSLIP